MEVAMEKKMTGYFAQMKGFLKMEDELEFAKFSAYYQDVMNCLQADYQELSQDELAEAQAICGLLGENANMRAAAKKDANRKKFQKMHEKCAFWQDAIKAKLKKEGMSEEEMMKKVNALTADEEEEPVEQCDCAETPKPETT